jgi:hypothetical protein
MNLQILNPLDIPDWDDLLLAAEGSSFFHSSAWARVLCDTYGYKPLYFASREKDKLAALIPFMEVNSILTGKRGVSLPFSDYCPPLCSDESQFREMLLGVTEYGKGAGWRYLEWRHAGSFLNEKTAHSRFYVHHLNLEPAIDAIFSSFRGNTQRNIKRAVQQGLNVEILNSLESLNEFYRLHCMTRKEHGFPPQPFRFFREIFEHIISQKKGVIVLALYREVPVAGGVFFHFGDKGVFKYGASDKKYHYLKPNNLVMWEAIRWCKVNSFRDLNFGRTDFEDRGLVHFKNGWGTESHVVLYHQYNYQRKAFARSHKGWDVASRFARKLPSPIFNLVGSLLYRHVA